MSDHDGAAPEISEHVDSGVAEPESSSVMTPERWRQVQWLFDAVLAQEPDERPGYLEQITVADPALRSEVASLIRSLESASQFLDEGALVGQGLEALAETRDGSGRVDAPFTPGTRVGVYRLERLLGSGGAGQVFLAVRDDEVYEKKVAVKVLKRGMDTDELVRRFVSERQILAQLEHPNIAKLLDGGAADDGRPYLVMEYVDGQPIHRWCSEKNLDVRQRIELFLAVCDAVHFAHTNLVVHRDLKPGNILVGADGAPKLLDFGIAKLLDPTAFPRTVLTTAPGWRAMTPEYASPEQVQGRVVTTASDVYSLGIVLYEMLTGQRPYELRDRSPVSIERVVCEEEAPLASRVVRRRPDTESENDRTVSRELERRLTGDLDDILRMALEKEPEHRYRSVERLADDLRRHLEGRPVLARKPTLVYRASKFVRRNRLLVGAAVLVFALLVVFLFVLRDERIDTLRQRDRAELVSSFMTRLFEIPDPSRERGETITARDLLDRGVRDAEALLRDQPEVLGELLGTMGTTYTNLGLYDEAERLLERSLEMRESVFGPRSSEAATARQQLANLTFAADELGRSEKLARSALESRIGLFGEVHESVVESRLRLALIRQRQGDHDEAGQLLESAEAGARALELDELLVRILWRSGLLARYLDDPATARQQLDEARLVSERLWGELHPEVALILNQLSEVEKHQDAERARQLLERAREIQRKVYKEPHPDMVQVVNNLAVLDELVGRLDEAEERYREVLELQRTIVPEGSLIEAIVLNNLARVLAERGRFEEAEVLYQRSLELHRELLGPRHEETANVLNNLGSLARSWGRTEQAETHYRLALEILLETVGEGHSRLAPVYNNLGELALAGGDNETAARAFGDAAAVLRPISEQHLELPRVLQNQAAAMARLGNSERAEALYLEALAILEGVGDTTGPQVAVIHTNLTVAKIRAGEHAEGEEWGRRAVELYEGLSGVGSPDWLRARRLVVVTLDRQGRKGDAEALAADNLAICEEGSEAPEEDCARHRTTLETIRTGG